MSFPCYLSVYGLEVDDTVNIEKKRSTQLLVNLSTEEVEQAALAVSKKRQTPYVQIQLVSKQLKLMVISTGTI